MIKERTTRHGKPAWLSRLGEIIHNWLQIRDQRVDHSDYKFPKNLRQDAERRDWLNIVFVIIGWSCYLIAAGMASYAVYNMINNEIIQRSVAKTVVKDVKAWPSDDVKRDYATAKAYNDSIGDMKNRVIGDVTGEDGQLIEQQDKTYMDALNINHSGAMAVLRIPKISAEMTIYHTTSTDSLSNGVGHVYGTALPIGQNGTMSAIAAHSGGVNGLFFTRLHQMKIGDYFYVDVLGQEQGYKVDWIKVVDPEDIGDAILHTKPNEARITMITCTPIGVNTQRLLVSGVKQKTPQDVPSSATQKDSTFEAIIWAIIVFITLLLIAMIYRWLQRQQPGRHIARTDHEKDILIIDEATGLQAGKLKLIKQHADL